MKDAFVYARGIRQEIAKICNELSNEQLNKIPAGAGNNIAWQLGHIVVSTEILCYQKTGIEPDRVIPFVEDYKNGTHPKANISESEIKKLIRMSRDSLNQIEQDYLSGRFQKITPYKTSTIPVEVTDIESVLFLCSHHDSWHYGQIRFIRRLVQNS